LEHSVACLAPKIKVAIAANLYMQTPKEKFSVGSLLGVFGMGKKIQEIHYQDTVFSDTLQPDFEDTSPGVLHTQKSETAPDASAEPQATPNSVDDGKT
jgi:hypothetical protein